jgi:hypothetical protein
LRYRLVYTQRAVKDIEVLDPNIKQRIGKTLLRYEKDPLKYADKLTDPKVGTYQIRVELHWRFSSKPYLFPLSIDQLRESRQSVTITGNPVETLDTENAILYLCAHGAIHIWIRLFWLCDVAELLHNNYSIDWSQMMEHAAELGLSRSLAEELVLSSLLFDIPLPELIRAYVERDSMVRSLVKTALRIITHPNGLSCTPLTSIYMGKKLHEFRLHSDLRYKLFVWVNQISPLPDDLRTIPFTKA